MNPPPITTALFGFALTWAAIFSTSSTVRSVMPLSIPGRGGTTGEAPGLSINLS